MRSSCHCLWDSESRPVCRFLTYWIFTFPPNSVLQGTGHSRTSVPLDRRRWELQTRTPGLGGEGSAVVPQTLGLRVRWKVQLGTHSCQASDTVTCSRAVRQCRGSDSIAGNSVLGGERRTLFTAHPGPEPAPALQPLVGSHRIMWVTWFGS